MRVIGWCLNLVYGVALTAALPVLIYQAVVRGKRRGGWAQKLWGAVPPRTSASPCIWFHAVSVGEVLLLRTVIADLLRRRRDVEIWISTTTSTGREVAQKTFPGCPVIYFPLDFTWAVNRALRRVRPDLIALVELEIWPNLLRAAEDFGIPTVLINGRVSERSFRGYARIRALIAPTLRRIHRIAVQTDEYADRLRRLGAPADRLLVTGSIKFDGLTADRRNPHTLAIRRDLGLTRDDLVFMAGSTHDPEERLVVETYRQLKSEFPTLRLVLAPRHRERFDVVADLLTACGHPPRRRSASSTDASAKGDVILLDTLGELSAAWGLADVAFVGGSFCQRGGQNMLEPAAYGAAVVVGPNTEHFREIVELLRSRGGIQVVEQASEFTDAIRNLLNDRSMRRAIGEAARELVRQQQGGTVKTVDIICSMLPDDRRARKAA